MFMTITRDYGELSCEMLRGCEYEMQDLPVRENSRFGQPNI